MLRSTAVFFFVVVCVSGCVSGGGAGDAPVAPKGVRDLRINEVAAAGDPVDWFELFNVGGNDVALDGARFSDDEGSPGKGVFADGAVVSAGEFFVVDVDDLGAGFKLASDEALFLFAAENEALVDSVDWAEGESPKNGSFARAGDGDGEFATVVGDTKGVSNVP